MAVVSSKGRYEAIPKLPKFHSCPIPAKRSKRPRFPSPATTSAIAPGRRWRRDNHVWSLCPSSSRAFIIVFVLLVDSNTRGWRLGRQFRSRTSDRVPILRIRAVLDGNRRDRSRSILPAFLVDRPPEACTDVSHAYSRVVGSQGLGYDATAVCLTHPS